MDIRAPTVEDLTDLFGVLETEYFLPHPMTGEAAARIAGHVGRDVYLVGCEGGVTVAYGMLRGWDEGFAIPYLGIAVRPSHYRRGFGRAMMRALQELAQARGAREVRLRVHDENERAQRLYESLGYAYIGRERGERLMRLPLVSARRSRIAPVRSSIGATSPAAANRGATAS